MAQNAFPLRLLEYGSNALASRLRPPSHAGFWIAVALFIKVSFFVYFNLDVMPSDIGAGTLYECGGDCSSYIGPIENWISNGAYAPDFRLPGYGAIYLVFRAIFNPVGAMNCLVLVQLLFSGVSTYVLARLSSRVFPQSLAVFHGVFLTYALSTYVSVYDRQILTESLMTAASIIGVGLLVLDPPSSIPLRGPLLAGAFLSWAVFLRPVALPLIFLGAIFLWVSECHSGEAKARRTKAIVALLLPFVLTSAAWGIRSWRVHRTSSAVVPTVISPGVEPLWGALIRFHQSWGGNFVYWDPAADIHWFGYVSEDWEPTFTPVVKDPPSWVSTPEFGRDELLSIRDSTLIACNKDIPAEKRAEHRDIAVKRLDVFSEALKRDRPFVYYVLAPIRATFGLLATSGSYILFRRPFAALDLPDRIIKVFMSGLYVFVVVFGLAGIFFRPSRSPAWVFVAAIPLYIIGVHGVYFRFTENRYVVPAYPFLLIFANGLVLGGLNHLLPSWLWNLRRLPRA